MIILSRAEKYSIYAALQVQLKRISDEKEANKGMPLSLLLRINEEISRLNNLIKKLSEAER